MPILKMTSIPPMTEYAPSWDYSFYVSRWSSNEADVDVIRNWLLENENKIIQSLEYDYDGNTGLGKDSITGRFSKYNLFEFSQELPELTLLLDFIRESYIDFMTQENNPVRETELVSWYNVLRDGDQVKEHNHGAGHDVYISGTFSLDNYTTHTNFKCPYDRDIVLPIPNLKGLLTLFPSCIPHYSDVHTGDTERLTIAFDIRIPGIQESKDRRAIKFI